MSTVLYVEDHPPAQLLMRAIISDLTTHQLVVAGNGAEAETLAAAEQPDLYIVDLDLPDIDGLALARVLKTIHPAPVLLVSAYGEAVNTETVQDVIYAYLAKPLDPIHVSEIIQRTLA